MGKSNCKPTKVVSKAGSTLSTSKNKSAKSNAGKILAAHKNKQH